MNTEELQKRLVKLFTPLIEEHLAHSVKMRKYQTDYGEVDPEPTRLEAACKKAADAHLKANGGIVTVNLQPDSQLHVQVAKDDPENVILNFIIAP